MRDPGRDDLHRQPDTVFADEVELQAYRRPMRPLQHRAQQRATGADDDLVQLQRAVADGFGIEPEPTGQRVVEMRDAAIRRRRQQADRHALVIGER